LSKFFIKFEVFIFKVLILLVFSCDLYIYLLCAILKQPYSIIKSIFLFRFFPKFRFSKFNTLRFNFKLFQPSYFIGNFTAYNFITFVYINKWFNNEFAFR